MQDVSCRVESAVLRRLMWSMLTTGREIVCPCIVVSLVKISHSSRARFRCIRETIIDPLIAYREASEAIMPTTGFQPFNEGAALELQIELKDPYLGGTRYRSSDLTNLASEPFAQEIAATWDLSLDQVKRVNVRGLWWKDDIVSKGHVTVFLNQESFLKMKATILRDLMIIPEGYPDAKPIIEFTLVAKAGVISDPEADFKATLDNAETPNE